MGQKTNPVAFRLGVKGSNSRCKSHWFAKRGQYADFVIEDFRIREF